MRLVKSLLNNGKPLLLEEDISFPHDIYNNDHLRNIPFCHVKMKAEAYEEYVVVHFDIHSEVTAVCAYTLEDVPLKLHLQEDINVL